MGSGRKHGPNNLQEHAFFGVYFEDKKTRLTDGRTSKEVILNRLLH